MTCSASRRRVTVLILVVCSVASCTRTAGSGGQLPEPATGVPTTARPTPPPVAGNEGSPWGTPAQFLAGFSFPTEIAPARRYVFYLHGKIIEDQGIPATSPEYGEYRYEDILRALQSYGFAVISEPRPRDADSIEYAQRVAMQVHDLLSAGVPPGSITVVGASKGAAIAATVSCLLRNSEVNYVLLGACNPPTVDELRQRGVSLFGNVLAIYDASDVYAGSCEGLFALSEGNGLGRRAELVLHVGTGHGILYQPLSEWVLPTVRWANQDGQPGN